MDRHVAVETWFITLQRLTDIQMEYSAMENIWISYVHV